MTLGSVYDNRHLTYGPWSYMKANRHAAVGGRPVEGARGGTAGSASHRSRAARQPVRHI